MTKNSLINPSLLQAIRLQNPNITDSDAAIVVDKMQREMGEHLIAGDLLAFVRINPNNTFDLTVYEIDSRKKAQGK